MKDSSECSECVPAFISKTKPTMGEAPTRGRFAPLILAAAFEFDSSCGALWGALQLESNSNASFRRRLEFKIFKRPKNREDGSKFDDFLTKSIASARTKI